MLLDRLFGVFPDIAGQFVTSHDVIFAVFRRFQVGIGGLTTDDADLLKVMNCLLVRVVDVDRHFEGTVLHTRD